MPEFMVNSDATDATSQNTLNQVAELQDRLNQIRNDISNLLTNGYNTPVAQAKFAPLVDRFAKDFSEITETLQQIAVFIRSVGDSFTEADDATGALFGDQPSPQATAQASAAVGATVGAFGA